MPYADADSQARLELPSPTVVRDWRAETNRQIRLNYEDHVNKWQERMLHQHMQNRNFPRQDVLPISNIAKACGNVSTDSPTGVEDMESVDSVSSNCNDGRGRDSDGRRLFAGVAKGNGADDVCDGDVTWGSQHTWETAYACNNSGKNAVDAQEKIKSEKAAEQRLGAGPYRSSHRPTLVGRRSKSPDVSIAESTGTFLSKISDRNMTNVKETQPLGGPKYYVMTNTKKGKAKVVHEAMPATGREGFKLAMEEKGYEIIEYDMLPGGAKKPLSVNTPSNSTLKMEGVEFLQTNLLTGMFKSRQELPEKRFSMRMQRSTEKIKESSCQHFNVPITMSVQTGRNSSQSWFNNEFNKFLDVADKIDRAITGCTTADDDIANDDGEYSPTSEEEGDEDVTPHDRYRGRSSRHRRGRSRTRRR
jgi:hypothetical protein